MSLKLRFWRSSKILTGNDSISLKLSRFLVQSHHECHIPFLLNRSKSTDFEGTGYCAIKANFEFDFVDAEFQLIASAAFSKHLKFLLKKYNLLPDQTSYLPMRSN